eukprot:SAG22_NODE_911_length_6541_cov_6.161285_3_plen_68_part_00
MYRRFGYYMYRTATGRTGEYTGTDGLSTAVPDITNTQEGRGSVDRPASDLTAPGGFIWILLNSYVFK